MDAAAVERLHASLGRARVIVLDESVVEALQIYTSAGVHTIWTTSPDEAEECHGRGQLMCGGNLQWESLQSCQG